MYIKIQYGTLYHGLTGIKNFNVILFLQFKTDNPHLSTSMLGIDIRYSNLYVNISLYKEKINFKGTVQREGSGCKRNPFVKGELV
jgi:hypothetical protein